MIDLTTWFHSMFELLAEDDINRSCLPMRIKQMKCDKEQKQLDQFIENEIEFKKEGAI
jgi:hypothetical protein